MVGADRDYIRDMTLILLNSVTTMASRKYGGMRGLYKHFLAFAEYRTEARGMPFHYAFWT